MPRKRQPAARRRPSAASAVAVHDVVRALEVEISAPSTLTLRIEVLRSAGKRRFWTRVWRHDLYRLTPFSARRGKRVSDETILVEDEMFSRRDTSARSATDALRQTLARIQRQLGIATPKLD